MLCMSMYILYCVGRHLGPYAISDIRPLCSGLRCTHVPRPRDAQQKAARDNRRGRSFWVSLVFTINHNCLKQKLRVNTDINYVRDIYLFIC